MRVFVFISATDRDVLGFTADQVGANLPREYAPWTAATEGGAVLVHNAASESDTDIVLDGIRRDGFFMAVGGYEDETLPLSLRAIEPDPINHRLLHLACHTLAPRGVWLTDRAPCGGQIWGPDAYRSNAQSQISIPSKSSVIALSASISRPTTMASSKHH